MKKGIDIRIENGRRIVKGMGYYEYTEIKDLRELVKGSVGRFGSKDGFKFKDKQGNVTTRSFYDLDRDIDSLGTALIDIGLKGTHISIIGENRYEWGAAYFSITNGTGIAVPLDKNLPRNEIENLVVRGKVKAIFYSPQFHPVMTEIAADNRDVRYFICFETLPDAGNADPRFVDMPGLIAKGAELLKKGDRAFVDAAIDREVLSVLLFTSGTTSISKGVMLSHANLACNVSAMNSVIRVYPTDVHLSLLPLHHTFENTVGLLLMVHSGVCICYCDGIKHIAQNLSEYKVSVLVAVPAILDSMYRKLQDGIRKSGKDKLFKILTGVSDFLRLLGIDLRRKLFKTVFAQLGPRLRLAVSGAAPLDPKVVIGFRKIGLNLLEGYGLTETSPVVAANNDFINIPGTIGYPLAGVDMAIDAPDENGLGEIITRGGNVMLGYYENPEATAEATTADGWFRTGDIGYIDDKGLTRITGRAKSMIVFGSGKKAFPEEFEVILNNLPGVKESFSWGNKAPDGDIQVCVKLVVDREKLNELNGRELDDKEIGAFYDARIKDVNKTIPQYKNIRNFILSMEDLVKTTTLKIKRPIESERIRESLEKAGVDIRKAHARFI